QQVFALRDGPPVCHFFNRFGQIRATLCQGRVQTVDGSILDERQEVSARLEQEYRQIGLAVWARRQRKDLEFRERGQPLYGGIEICDHLRLVQLRRWPQEPDARC